MNMKKILSILLSLVMVLSLAACGVEDVPETTDSQQTEAQPEQIETNESTSATQAQPETRIVTDWTGREVEIPTVVESIICVNVSTLRYTAYLGALDLLVGVEEHEIGGSVAKPYGYVNQAAFEGLPLTGNNGETYDEEIIAADPDILVAYYDAEAADDLQERTGIPVVTIPHLEGILDEEVFFTLEFLGEVYGRQERAAELIAYLNGIKQDISDRIATVPEEERPSVYVGAVSYRGSHGFEGTEAGYGPLAELGANNIAASSGEALPFNIDVEEVLAQDPDYIFLEIGNMDLVNEQYALDPDFFNSFTAVQEGNVYSQVSFRYNATNTELALCNMYYIATVLYPEAFADVDPIEKTNEIIEMFLGVENYYDVLKEAGYEFKQLTLGE